MSELEEIFLAEGFLGLTLDELAARLKCSKTTLYRLAASKEQLVVAVARHFYSCAAARIEAATEAAPTPEARISAYLTQVSQEMRRGSATFHEQLATWEPTVHLYRRNSRFAAERVQLLIHEGAAEGVFREADAELAGIVVGLVINGLHQDMFRLPARASQADVYDTLCGLILHGIVERGPVVPNHQHSEDSVAVKVS